MRQPITESPVPLSAAQEEVVREQSRRARELPAEGQADGPKVTAICHSCAVVRKHLTQAEAVDFRRQHATHPVHLAAEELPVVEVVAEAQQWIRTLVDHATELQRAAEHARSIFRTVASDVLSQTLRLRNSEPEGRALMLVAQEAVGTWRSFLRALDRSKDAITTIAPMLNGQLKAIEDAKQAPASAATLAPITAEVVSDRLSAHEEQLHAARKALQTLRHIVQQAEWRAAHFDACTKIVVEACLVGYRAVQIQVAAARLQAIKEELAQLRTISVEEQMIVQCCTEAGVATGVPLRWPVDLLEPPA